MPLNFSKVHNSPSISTALQQKDSQHAYKKTWQSPVRWLCSWWCQSWPHSRRRQRRNYVTFWGLRGSHAAVSARWWWCEGLRNKWTCKIKLKDHQYSLSNTNSYILPYNLCLLISSHENLVPLGLGGENPGNILGPPGPGFPGSSNQNIINSFR